jgi:serine/threonine protein kinase
MELSVQNVYGLLLRSRLLPLDEARTMFRRWESTARDSVANAERFTKWLVAEGYLTDYQVSLLARGHADGFFLDQYKILERLGKGRMAGVYKAVHRLGPVVAIKVLPPSRARDPQLLARFQREAQLALSLKHPHIVRAFQVGEAGRLHYLVMEYLEGETLEDVLERRGSLPPAEAIRVAYQALLGLQHIHEQGFIHRDLKPSNLMLAGVKGQGSGVKSQESEGSSLTPVVKILDIGLGRVFFDEHSPLPAVDQMLTTEGMVLGTPDYLSPEQARDPRSVDIRSDLYSLGCVLYHCLTGQAPFPDSNLISQMIRHATEPPRPLRDFNAALPDGLQPIINRLLAKEPAQRYATPERAAQALKAFLAAGMEPSPHPEASPQMRSYLTWLETEARKPPPTPPAPVPPAVSLRKSNSKLKGSASKRRSRKQKRQRAKGSHVASAQPTAAPVAVPVGAIEPVPAGARKREAAEGWRLDRRDFLLFALGAGSVLLAIGVGWLLAQLFGKGKPPAEPIEEKP